MHRILVVALHLLVAFAVCARAAQACSCLPESEDEMVERAALAVLAEAIADAPFEVSIDATLEILHARREAVTLFRVLEVLSGRFESERIAVVHDLAPASCGVRFRSGERYLLAFRARAASGEPEVLRAGLCHVRHRKLGGSAMTP